MRTILYIAWTGLVLSITVHIMTFIGYDEFLNDWEAFVFFLHGGAILLWLPVVIFPQKMMKGRDKKDFWKIAFENCPVWMKKLVSFCVAYGFLSFFAILFLAKNGTESDTPFRLFSSGWIIAYSVEIGVIYSYLHRPINKLPDKPADSIPKLSISKKDLLTLPVITMILANLIPAVGIIFFKWDAFVIVSLYWIETIIIGFFAILRFIFVPIGQIKLKHKLIGTVIFPLILGWCLSAYGVALFFLFVIFPNRNMSEAEKAAIIPEGDYYQISWPGPFGLYELGIDTLRLMYHMLPSLIIIPIIFLIFSHIVSFVNDYLINKDKRLANLQQLANETGLRILAFHLSIMIGGFLIAVFYSNMGILIILVLAKCCMEVKLYLSQKNKAKRKFNHEVIIDLKPLNPSTG